MNFLANKKTLTLTVGGVIAFITAFVQLPQVMSFVQGLLAAHPNLSAIVAGIAAILALFHNPTPGS